MNEFIGNIIEKCGKDIGFALIKALCSAACAFITNNIWLTLFYILVTTLFDVLTMVYEEISLENIINKIFKIKNTVKYMGFIVIAFLPTIVCFLLKEISYDSVVDLLIKRSYNWIPNLFGALIVCSLIKYLSNFKAEDILCAAIHLKKELFDVIMRYGFMIAFLNAINHSIRHEQTFTEFFNMFHLCAVIFSGVVILGTFALWLVSEKDSKLDKSKIYPTSSLGWCFCFLLSCVCIPIVLENAENEWILLSFNAVTAIAVAWSFLIFVKRKNKLQLKDCPVGAVIAFIVGVLGIVGYGVVNMEISEKSSIIRQLVSGVIMLSGTVILLLVINSIQKRKVNESI